MLKSLLLSTTMLLTVTSASGDQVNNAPSSNASPSRHLVTAKEASATLKKATTLSYHLAQTGTSPDELQNATQGILGTLSNKNHASPHEIQQLYDAYGKLQTLARDNGVDLTSVLSPQHPSPQRARAIADEQRKQEFLRTRQPNFTNDAQTSGDKEKAKGVHFKDDRAPEGTNNERKEEQRHLLRQVLASLQERIAQIDLKSMITNPKLYLPIVAVAVVVYFMINKTWAETVTSDLSFRIDTQQQELSKTQFPVYGPPTPVDGTSGKSSATEDLIRTVGSGLAHFAEQLMEGRDTSILSASTAPSPHPLDLTTASTPWLQPYGPEENPLGVCINDQFVEQLTQEVDKHNRTGTPIAQSMIKQFVSGVLYLAGASTLAWIVLTR